LKVILLIGAGLAVVLALSNKAKCSQGYQTLDQHGNVLSDGAPCPIPGTCQVISVQHTPAISCLFNPFPEGML
jgi:hypothetical protein